RASAKPALGRALEAKRGGRYYRSLGGGFTALFVLGTAGGGSTFPPAPAGGWGTAFVDLGGTGGGSTARLPPNGTAPGGPLRPPRLPSICCQSIGFPSAGMIR